MAFTDSLGNHYSRLPAKKANKGAKGAAPGPKHGRKSRYSGEKKKHGPATGRFRKDEPQVFSQTFRARSKREGLVKNAD